MRANLVPAIIVAVLSFGAFRWCYLRSGSVPARVAMVVVALLAAVPAVLFASNYALYIPYARWFFLFHSLPGAEITSGLAAGILGVMFASAKLRPAKLNAPILAVSALLTLALVLTPFAKQLLYAVDYGALGDRWQDGVCLQTTKYTCVPACTATYMRLHGWPAAEQELARSVGTTSRGTEMWYLMRALRRRGYEPVFSHARSVKDAPVPSIIGVHIGDIGHVVVLLSKDETGATVGEPLTGRHRYTWPVLIRRYRPDGTSILIKKTGNSQ